MICIFNFSCPFIFTYFDLNSCDGNDAILRSLYARETVQLLHHETPDFISIHRDLYKHPTAPGRTQRLWHSVWPASRSEIPLRHLAETGYWRKQF